MRVLRLALAIAAAFAAFSLSGQMAMADDLFVVRDVHVDASAASASVAQLAAIAQGRPKAWTILFHRLARSQDWRRQPQLDDAALQRLIRGFSVRNERRSTTRYVADVTYVFSPEAVQRALQSAGVAFTQFQARRVLLLPFAPGYARNSVWAAALSNPRLANGVVPFALPSADPIDQSALGGLNFETATWSDVEPAASRIHAGEAVLVQAVPGQGHLTVTLRRLGSGQLPAKSSVEVPYVQGGAQSTYPNAAEAAVRALEEMWKARNSVDFSQTGKLAADVRIASLPQWGAMQTALAAVPNVAGVSVIAMDIGEARITISYLGTPDQLREALAQQGLILADHGGEWSLSTSGSP